MVSGSYASLAHLRHAFADDEIFKINAGLNDVLSSQRAEPDE